MGRLETMNKAVTTVDKNADESKERLLEVAEVGADSEIGEIKTVDVKKVNGLAGGTNESNHRQGLAVSYRLFMVTNTLSPVFCQVADLAVLCSTNAMNIANLKQHEHPIPGDYLLYYRLFARHQWMRSLVYIGIGSTPVMYKAVMIVYGYLCLPHREEGDQIEASFSSRCYRQFTKITCV